MGRDFSIRSFFHKLGLGSGRHLPHEVHNDNGIRSSRRHRFSSRGVTTPRTRAEALALAADAEARLLDLGIKVKHRPTKEDLKEQMAESYPSLTYQEYASQTCCPNVTTSCSICLCDFEDDDQVRQMKCSTNHVFHSECIDNWAAVSNSNKGLSCPLCNSVLLNGGKKAEPLPTHCLPVCSA